MLLLLFKNMLWAAWWPYYTMLLALAKAAEQQDRSQRAATEPAEADGSETQQEKGMASNAYVRAEIPEPLRDLVKMGIEQARRAFETFAATSEKAWRSLENSSPSSRASLFAMNAKIVEIARANAAASFALAMKLAEATDTRQAIELQSQHVARQMETFVRQLEEMRDLAARAIQDAVPATRTETADASGPAAAGPSGSAAFASYAPSSSVTPGKSGRSY